MDKGYIEYIQCGNYESEIERFWLEIKEDTLEIIDDPTLLDFQLRRQFVGAVSGEFAGILTDIIISLPECVLTTILLWEKISKHLKSNREKKRLPRILNMKLLENLCRLELLQNGVENFELKEAKKLVPDDDSDEDSHEYFSYNDDAYKCTVAKFTFESKKHLFKFKIDNDGEIKDFKKSVKKE